MFPTVAATLGEVCSCGRELCWRQLGLKSRKLYLLHVLWSVRILFEQTSYTIKCAPKCFLFSSSPASSLSPPPPSPLLMWHVGLFLSLGPSCLPPPSFSISCCHLPVPYLEQMYSFLSSTSRLFHGPSFFEISFHMCGCWYKNHASLLCC